MDPSPALITITQVVPAPPARVYAAWTDAALLATWWRPQLPDTTYDVDAVVGGAYRFRSEAAGIGVHGRFVALESPHRLELSWVWEDGPGHGPEERVVVDLAAGAGTVVTVTHAVTSSLGAEDFRRGWSDCLARLGKFH